MDENLQLKLQAYADGELSERKAHEIAEWIAKDGEAGALLVELRNTRDALRRFDSDIKLPESREFYWSKIAREIEHAEKSFQTESPGLFARVLRRFLLPATAVAALALAVFLASSNVKNTDPLEVEVAMAGSDPFTYHDYSSGTTLVWVSYPSENEFADPESEDIMD